MKKKTQKKSISVFAEDTLRAFRGAYIDVAQRLKSEQGKENEDKNPEVEQLDFEFVLFSSAIIDYDYIMALIAKYTQTEPKKQKMSKEQLTTCFRLLPICLMKEKILSNISIRFKLVWLWMKRKSKQGIRNSEQKNNQEINIIAKKHGIEIQSLQAFIQETIDRMIFDGEKLSDLLAPLDLKLERKNAKRTGFDG